MPKKITRDWKKVLERPFSDVRGRRFTMPIWNPSKKILNSIARSEGLVEKKKKEKRRVLPE